MFTKNAEESIWDVMHSLLYERLEETTREYEKTKNYQDLSSEEDRLYEKLESRLPEDLQQALVQYSDVLNEITVGQQEFFYRKGFSDGWLLAKLMMKE